MPSSTLPVVWCGLAWLLAATGAEPSLSRPVVARVIHLHPEHVGHYVYDGDRDGRHLHHYHAPTVHHHHLEEVVVDHHHVAHHHLDSHSDHHHAAPLHYHHH